MMLVILRSITPQLKKLRLQSQKLVELRFQTRVSYVYTVSEMMKKRPRMPGNPNLFWGVGPEKDSLWKRNLSHG